MKPADAPTVCVVDDDPSVRASIQGPLKSANLRSASFRTAEEFLHSNAAGRAQPPCFGREPAWSQRSSPHFSQRGGWGANFIRTGSLRINFSGCCCKSDPFSAFRESFSLSEDVSAHTLRSEEHT